MLTVADIITKLGGATESGLVCGFEQNPASRGSDMKQRGKIPPAYWSRIVEAAKAKDLAAEINYDTLAKVYAAPRYGQAPTQAEGATR